jgi:hypothetical protein
MAQANASLTLAGFQPFSAPYCSMQPIDSILYHNYLPASRLNAKAASTYRNIGFWRRVIEQFRR